MPERLTRTVTVPPNEWTFIGDNPVLDTKIYLWHANEHPVDYLVALGNPEKGIWYDSDSSIDGYRLLSVPNEIAARVDVSSADGLPPGM